MMETLQSKNTMESSLLHKTRHLCRRLPLVLNFTACPNHDERSEDRVATECAPSAEALNKLDKQEADQ